MIASTTKFKQTKRNFRIWIEGKKLTDAGFTWRSKYTRTITSDGDQTMVVFALLNHGELTVAGRNRNGKEQPIIDFTTTRELFKPGTDLLVTYTPGVITIREAD